MALLLIRHGETDLNAARVVQFPDTPLGENGQQQAEQLGRGLKHRRLDLVLTSDYRRARMTADAVAGHAGAPLLELTELRERNFGDIRGRSYDEFSDIDIFAESYHPPGGESWPQFNARVDRAWDAITAHATERAGDIAVVTHGLVLRSLLVRTLDTQGHVIDEDLVVANTSVTEVEHGPPWRVRALATTTHLASGPGDVAPV